MKLTYKALESLSDKEIERIIACGSLTELTTLSLSVGEYHPKWKYAQDVCEVLSKHEDASVRANAVLGFAYIARTKGVLEKHIVKPILLKELKENIENKGRIIVAIEDTNIFMKWNIGKNALENRSD